MTYEIALNKAWDEITELAPSEKYNVRYFTDSYEVKVTDRTILLGSSNASASEDISILILHYLTGILKHGFHPKGEWVSFKGIRGGQSYYPALQENTIRPILESFKDDPDGLIAYLAEHLEGSITKDGDVSVELVSFPDVRIRIILLYGDDEFPPEVMIYFDRELAEIISTEDIAVMLFHLAERIRDIR